MKDVFVYHLRFQLLSQMALFSVPELNFLSFYVDFARIVKYTTGSLCKGATSLILASLKLMNSSGVDQST